MKIIYNRIIPFGRRYYAINLFGILFAKGPCNEVIINHEKIHTAQMREMGYLFFYVWYVVEWLVNLIRFGNSYKAYQEISFEREAYRHEEETDYLARRRRWGWIYK